jgi:oligopeptide transport system ATP-binding protein
MGTMSRLLEVRGLCVDYRLGRAWLQAEQRRLRALHCIDLDVEEGRSIGVVGESGCGKSTLARAILGLSTPAAGEIRWQGWVVSVADRPRMHEMRRGVQVVFQDPFGSLDPRMTIGESVAEALDALEGVDDPLVVRARTTAVLEEVGLDAGLAGRYPHELSGGQCQRAAIARATVARPRLLICDEAVSALDVSVQAQVVNLLHELRARHRMALMFISHNLAVVRNLCDEVVVMYLGRVVERAPRDQLFTAPRHPYTRGLLASVPEPDPAVARRQATLPWPADTGPATAAGAGCPFAPRCAWAEEHCRQTAPALEAVDGHAVACHRWRNLIRDS